MPPPVRAPALRQGKSGVSQVPHHQAGPSALGVRGIREGLVTFVVVTGRCLRIVRRFSRSRVPLPRRHELGRAIRSAGTGSVAGSEVARVDETRLQPGTEATKGL